GHAAVDVLVAAMVQAPDHAGLDGGRVLLEREAEAGAADGLLDLVLLGQGDVVVALDAGVDAVVDPDRTRGTGDGASHRGGEQDGADPTGIHGAVRCVSVDVVEHDAGQL